MFHKPFYFSASDIPVLKEVEAIMEPASFNMVRFVVSAIPFLPFILQERGDSHTRSTGIELGFWVSCGYLSQALGLLTSEAGHVSFISAFTVSSASFSLFAFPNWHFWIRRKKDQ